jgi:hypothetical protein
VKNEGSPLEAKRTGAPKGLALPTFVWLQAVELPSMEAYGYDVPEPAAGRTWGSRNACSQCPTIYGMALEALLALALHLYKSIPFP